MLITVYHLIKYCFVFSFLENEQITLIQLNNISTFRFQYKRYTKLIMYRNSWNLTVERFKSYSIKTI